MMENKARLSMALLVALVLAACGDGGEQEATPSPQATPTTITAAGTPTLPTEGLPDAPSGAVVFAAMSNWDTGIYRVNPDGGGLTRLSEEPSKDWTGGWSPDGSQIGFTSSREGDSDILLMASDGSNARNITNTPDRNESFYSWSPDGSRILFYLPSEGWSEWWVMNADGSEQRQVIPTHYECFQLEWSPDGSRLFALLTLDGQAGVYVVNRDGTGLHRLETPLDLSEGWSSSPLGQRLAVGERLALVVYRESTEPTVFVMSAEGREPRQVYSGPAIHSVAWSPDGSRLAITSRDQLVTVSVDGGQVEGVASGSELSDAQWSPDGTRIAFVSQHEGNNEVYVVTADGGMPVNVSNSPWRDDSPSWSPDGRYLLFASEREGQDGIYWMRPDGAELTPLVAGDVRFMSGWPTVYPDLLTSCNEYIPPCTCREVCLSPDGELIAEIRDVREGEPWGDLVFRDATTGEERIVTPAEVQVEPVQPAWSPDSSRVAFYGMLQDKRWLYVLDREGQTAKGIAAIKDGAQTGFPILWSPDGEWLYYEQGGVCYRDGCSPGFVYRVRPDGTDEERLTDLRVGRVLGFVP